MDLVYILLWFILIAVILAFFFYRMEQRPELGIILLRHVSSDEVNEYWNHSLKSIREYFGPDIPVVIIDDNSNPEYVKEKTSMENTTVISSEYHQRGEILPYYYFYKHHWFEKAFIIHDSVFFHSRPDVSHVDDISFLWDFPHDWNNEKREKELISHLDFSSDLLRLYDKKDKWRGAFGSMSVVTHRFVAQLQEQYNIFILLDYIKIRSDRMCFERIISVISTALLPKQKTMYGCIHDFVPFSTSYPVYMTHLQEYKNLPLMKVWTGR